MYVGDTPNRSELLCCDEVEGLERPFRAGEHDRPFHSAAAPANNQQSHN